MGRDSGIKKKIELVLNLGNYESLRVQAEFSETVTWDTPEERKEKSKKITELLIKEIRQDVEKISKDLCIGDRAKDYSNAFTQIISNGSGESLDQVEEDEDFEV